jgi:peptidoglycan/xylan/chitin deacetylase (PgdA/CDA1 family)
MTKPTVAISVDCVCASQGKCYVKEIVEATEQYRVPFTWLLGVAEHDPLSNVKLYHNEYLHRIPAWHEIGLHLTFDASTGNTVARGDLIRIGKDVLKQFSIKPTSFRAANGDLEADDLRALEDIGIIIDSTPGSSAGRPLDSPNAPYHPSYTSVHHSGDAKLWVAPVANVGGARGYLDDGFDKLKPIIDAHLKDSSVLSLALCDCLDNADNVRHVLDYLKKHGARFVTLTQLASEL